ncbi:hypothetical protein [Burkholderia oklahomensis]|uniref:Uncharacterized protein n=1 Tax=Burkholderia oklahomensis TaxID=342113 RepID=A0AAI8FRI0_9BURK|nr:hypothetical protein [Burkholderia oklahomensis]AIO70264.1 hypothetical protein DM82_4389 [Burkholderia oklahomensis]QPS39557.1 hypothetical protein I6G57_27355 [Burkholderia oklahomensis]
MADLLSGAVTGLLPIVGVVVGALLTKKREHDADWRKSKLEHYREYMAALSGIVEGRNIEAAAHERYADAVNALMLVASARVLKALGALLVETSSPQRSREVHDRLLDDLLRAMRDDVQPSGRDDSGLLPFRLITVPQRIYQRAMADAGTPPTINPTQGDDPSGTTR